MYDHVQHVVGECDGEGEGGRQSRGGRIGMILGETKGQGPRQQVVRGEEGGYQA